MRRSLAFTAALALLAPTSRADAGEPLIDWISQGVNAVYPGDATALGTLVAAMNARNDTSLVPGSTVIFFHAEMQNLRSASGPIGNGRAQTLWLIAQVTDAEGRGANPLCPDPAGGEARIRSCTSVVPLQILTDSQALADHLAARGHAGLVTVVTGFTAKHEVTSGPTGSAIEWRIAIEDPRVSLRLEAKGPLTRTVEANATDGADFGSRPYPSAVAYGAEVTAQQFNLTPGTPGSSFALSIQRLELAVSFDGQPFPLRDLFRAAGPPLLVRTDFRHMRLVEP